MNFANIMFQEGKKETVPVYLSLLSLQGSFPKLLYGEVPRVCVKWQR